MAKASHWGDLRRQALFWVYASRENYCASVNIIENGYGDIAPFFGQRISVAFLFCNCAVCPRVRACNKGVWLCLRHSSNGILIPPRRKSGRYWSHGRSEYVYDLRVPPCTEDVRKAVRLRFGRLLPRSMPPSGCWVALIRDAPPRLCGCDRSRYFGGLPAAPPAYPCIAPFTARTYKI